MKTITIKVPPEATGLENYISPRDCPIARGLIKAGYHDVSVSHTYWSGGIKCKVLGVIPMVKRVRGSVPDVANDMAHYLSANKQTENTILKLTID